MQEYQNYYSYTSLQKPHYQHLEYRYFKSATAELNWKTAHIYYMLITYNLTLKTTATNT
uniref:Uncharacterized protein n=1 Tax=Sphingobacterium sp. (strain 21) TaxID=743722 RepID=F4C296_SPHS2